MIRLLRRRYVFLVLIDTSIPEIVTGLKISLVSQLPRLCLLATSLPCLLLCLLTALCLRITLVSASSPKRRFHRLPFFASGSGNATTRIWSIPEGSLRSGSQSGCSINALILKHARGKSNKKNKDVTTLDWNGEGIFYLQLVHLMAKQESGLQMEVLANEKAQASNPVNEEVDFDELMDINNFASIWFLALFLSIIATVILELRWSGVSITDLWRNKQFWVIGCVSAHLFAVLQGLLKVLFSVDTNFTVTSKGASDEADEFGDLYSFKWTTLLIPPTTLIILNMVGVVAGISGAINNGYGSWGPLFGKLLFA